MADVYPVSWKRMGKGPIPCPIDGSDFGPASMSIVTCPAGHHQFTLSPQPLGLVRVDNVSLEERMSLVSAANVAASLFMDKMDALNGMNEFDWEQL